MSKRLPYFQFEPAEFLAGDIQICSLEAQGLFIGLCCIYWQKECQLTLIQAKKRFKNEDCFKELIEENIIKIENENVKIDFLDLQFNEALERAEKLSFAGKKGAETMHKNRVAIATPQPSHNEAMPIRKEEIKEKKIKEEEIIYPTLDEVIFYFEENKYQKEVAQKFYNYYSIANWSDSNGNKIKNWKQKAQAVWFKEENKIIEQKRTKPEVVR